MNENILEKDGYINHEKAGTISVGGLDGYFENNLLERLSYAKPGIEPEIVPIAGVRRSPRTKLQTASYVPSMKGQKYHEALFNQMQMESPKVVATVMTQLSMKAGLKAWGDPAKSAVKEEMQQLHMRDTFQPRHWNTLTPEEKDRL